jgi:hypothetical protein
MGIFDGLPGLDTQKAEPKPSGIFDGLPGLDSPVAVMEEQTPAPVSQPAGVEASDEAVVPQSKSIFGRIAEIPENIRSFIPSIAEWKAFTGAYKTGELDKYMKPDDPRYAKSKIEHQQNGFSESVDAAKWALTYAMSLGGNIGPKGMKEELAKEAQSFTGLGSITIPSTTATATSALEWAYLYPAMFEAAGITTEAIKKLPLVQKALQAIEKSGGVQAIAEKFPRIYKGFISALESFEQGAMVGATKGTAEAVTQGMDIKEAAGHIAGEAAGFGLVSGAFSVASSVDKKMAADLLRKTMMQKMDSQLQGLIGQTTSPQQVKGLAGWRDNALRRIDDIVSAFEGDLYGMTEGNLYKNIGGGKIEDPRISAEKFLKYGYKPMSGGPAVQGVESLKTGIGQRKPGDIMTGVPTTRAGEVVEAVKHPIKTAQEQIRSLRESLPPPSAENVTLKGPVEPTPELARQIVQTSPDAAKAFADKPSPSRTDMESLGLPGSSAPIRKKLAEEIKVQLSTPAEEIAVQPKGPENEVIQAEMRRTEDQTIPMEDASTVPPITGAVETAPVLLGLHRKPVINESLSKMDESEYDTFRKSARDTVDTLERQFDNNADLENDPAFREKLAKAQDNYSSTEMEDFRRHIENISPEDVSDEFMKLSLDVDSGKTKAMILVDEMKKRPEDLPEMLKDLERKSKKDNDWYDWVKGQIEDVKQITASEPPQPGAVTEQAAPVSKEPWEKPVTAYHGTKYKFKEFKSSEFGKNTGAKSAKEGFFFSSKKEIAGGYADMGVPPEVKVIENEVADLEEIAKKTGTYEDNHKLEVATSKLYRAITQYGTSPDGTIKEVELDIRNPLVIDKQGATYNENEATDSVKKAKQEGYDGVIFKDVADSVKTKRGETPKASEISDVYVVFNENQIRESVGTVSNREVNLKIWRRLANKGVKLPESAVRMLAEYPEPSPSLPEQKGQEKRLTPDGKVKQTDVPSQEITKAPVESIQADPKRFQFKQDATEEGGVTQKLSSVEKWNEKAAGVVLVWEDNSGKRFVVDGHHRLALAKKLGVKNINVYVLKESEGVTDKDARAFGAMSNLADEKGTAVDAAKLFRDSDMSDADLKKEGVNIKSEIVKQGLAMKTLSDEVFRMVINGKVPANMAANIGKYVTDPVKQKAVADMIADGQVDTAREAELLAKTIDSAPVLRKEEQTLFGTDVTEKSLFAERAKVLANVEAILKTNKKVFGVLSTKSGIIEQAGNVLNKESNKAAKDKADEVLYLLEKMVNYKGPVAEALNEATKQYAENPTKAKLAEVSRELLDRWQKELTIENVGNVRQELPESKDEVKPKGGGDNLFSDYREPVKIEGYDESDQKPGTTVGMNSELYAGKGGETEVTNRPNSIVFGLKELVELTRSLLGDIPSVKKNLGAAAGRFYHKDDVGIGKILMSGNAAYGPKVSEGLTKKTGEDLANLIDGVVEKLSAKFAVKASDIKVEQTADGKKTLLKFYLRDPDYGAKVLAHEIGHASDWLPDNTLKRGNILGHVAALRNFTKSMIGESPEVVDDVLNDSDRKRLAKEARRIVKGTSPDNMKKGERNKIVADTLKDLVKQEAARRGIYTKAELNEELNKLSRWWKPIAGNASPEYVAYREKPAELYADAVSVLLNNPEALRKQAPKFYDAFFGYISSRPQAKEAYTALIDKIYAGTTRDEAIGRLLDGFRIGTEKQQGAINRRDIWKNIRSLFYSKFAENYALARKARASGIIDADTDPVNRIGEARYTSNMIEGYMNELQTAVYNPIAKAGIPLEVFDLFLLGKRVIGEEGQKFAPEGMTDKDWTGYLSDLRVKYKEKYKILEDAHDKMWEIRKRDILDKIKENEFFDKETMDSLYDEPYYVRFDVVDYIDKKNGIGSGLKLFKRVGTFRQVAGPLESTILQDMGMLYSLNWNSAKKSVAELNVKLDKATEAEKTFDGKRWIFKEPTDKDLRLMMYMDKGEMKGFYVDKWQAAGFDTHDPLEYKAIANIANTIAGGQKVIYTALTPAFWLPNIIKDSARTLINVPGANPINLAINLIKNVPLAWKSEYGTDSPKILEMMKHGALLSRANITGLTSDEALAGQLLTMHTGRKLDRQGRINPVGYIERAWQFYKHLGQFTERASKIASWDLIRKKNPDMPLREVAQMVRTEAGSPDFAEKGRLTWAVNPLMLFVNPGVQGLTTDLRVATQKGRRGSFWMKMAAYQIAPKLIQWAIGAGVLVSILKALGVGDDDELMVIAKEAQDIIKSQSEYVQTNYINIPIGKDENGKGIVLTIPMDHTGMALSGIMHNALNANAKGVGTALTNSVQYAIDQMPGGNQPIFTLAKWWKDYGRGVNPYDEYRGHTLIPKNEFEAKDLDPQHRAAKVLAKESLAQLGAGGFIKFNTGDPGRIKSTLEKLTYTPGIGPVISRFIRVSDYGVRQQLQEATGGVKSESAMNRLNIRDATVKSMRGEPLTQDEEQLLKENQSYSKQFADSKAVREQGDAISQSIAAALTKDERVAMYRKLREIKGSDFNLKPYAEKDIATSTLQMTDPASDRRKGEKLEDFKIRQANRKKDIAESIELLKFLGVTEKEALEALRASAKSRGYKTDIYTNGKITAYGERVRAVKKNLE